MPITVKLSNGQRSCQVTKEKTPDPLGEFLSALKNLTFKVEIKITDITLGDEQPGPPTAAEQQPSAPEPSQASAPKPAPTLAPAQPMVPKQPSTPAQDIAPRQTPTPAPTQTLVPKQPPAVVPAQATAPKQPPAMVPAQVMAPRPSPSTVPTQPAATRLPPAMVPAQVLVPKQPPAMVPPQVMTARQPSATAQTQAMAPVHTPEPAPEPVFEVAPEQELVATQQHTVEARQSPIVNRRVSSNSIPLGTIKETVCISVDTRMTPPFAYVADDENVLTDIARIIDLMTPDLDSSIAQPFNVGDYVLAKSEDDQMWYRAVVENILPAGVDVYFIDWGLRERVGKDRIRLLTHPDLSLTKFPACAIKVQFINTPDDVLEEVLGCEKIYRMKFEAYGREDECYYVSIIQ